jgi:hypothetical protein
LANRNSRRFSKFYDDQLDYWSDRLKEHFQGTGHSYDRQKRIDMMIQMEENDMEVDWSELDKDEGENWPILFQQAFAVWGNLSDQWDGMSGSYFGKQMSGIQDIMNILEIEEQKEVLKIVKIIDGKYSKEVNKKNKDAQKKK